jgi:hypothetical protein
MKFTTRFAQLETLDGEAVDKGANGACPFEPLRFTRGDSTEPARLTGGSTDCAVRGIG